MSSSPKCRSLLAGDSEASRPLYPTAATLSYALQKHLNDLRGLKADQLLDLRYER